MMSSDKPSTRSFIDLITEPSTGIRMTGHVESASSGLAGRILARLFGFTPGSLQPADLSITTLDDGRCRWTRSIGRRTWSTTATTVADPAVPGVAPGAGVLIEQLGPLAIEFAYGSSHTGDPLRADTSLRLSRIGLWGRLVPAPRLVEIGGDITTSLATGEMVSSITIGASSDRIGQLTYTATTKLDHGELGS